MPKIRSLDLVLLLTSLFGVNQGYTGRFISRRITWILRILNLCYTLVMVYLMLTYSVDEGYFIVGGYLAIDFIARKLSICLALLTIVIIQLRYHLQTQTITPIGRELYRLYESSTWNGNIYGCIARIVLYLGWLMLSLYLPVYAVIWDHGMNWCVVYLLFCWSNFVPTASTELISQTMQLLQHEFQVLCDITKGLKTRQDYGMEELRALNRRHASLLTLSNKVARFTGSDILLLIESEKWIILLSLSIQINSNSFGMTHWTKHLLDCGFFSYRIERIIHQCFRGHRITMEANRFLSTLDELNPLDLENDEFFLEFQILRKQIKLRRLQFDCNRFLKLEVKLIFHIFKYLLTLTIIFAQLISTHSMIRTSKPENGTEADNVTECYLEDSDVV